MSDRRYHMRDVYWYQQISAEEFALEILNHLREVEQDPDRGFDVESYIAELRGRDQEQVRHSLLLDAEAHDELVSFGYDSDGLLVSVVVRGEGPLLKSGALFFTFIDDEERRLFDRLVAKCGLPFGKRPVT